MNKSTSFPSPSIIAQNNLKVKEKVIQCMKIIEQCIYLYKR